MRTLGAKLGNLDRLFTNVMGPGYGLLPKRAHATVSQRAAVLVAETAQVVDGGARRSRSDDLRNVTLVARLRALDF